MADDATQFCEITGADRDTANTLLSRFQNNLQFALSAFYDGLAGGGSSAGGSGADEQPRTGKPNLKPVPPASMVSTRPTDGSAVHDGLHGSVSVHVFFPFKADDEVGGLKSPLRILMDPDHTLGALKTCVSEKTKIPTVVMRAVFNGKGLSDNHETLKQYGFSSKKDNELLLLYQPRDERGSVTIKESSGTVVLELKEGEWGVSTSVTELRAAVAAELDVDADTIELVHNGLTMKDLTTFGLNAVSAGATITVFTGAAPNTQKKPGGKKGKKGKS